jgi:hypothetical protein
LFQFGGRLRLFDIMRYYMWQSGAIGSIYLIPTDVIRCIYQPQWNRLYNQLDNPMLTRKRHELNQIIIGYF